MTKPERIRLLIMLPVLAGLIVLAYFRLQGGSVEAPVFDATGNYQPMAVENPSLRFDLLDRVHKVEYKGSHLNIFDYHRPPKISQASLNANRGQVQPPLVPAGPPPLVFDMKCFGFVAGPVAGMRRAFFQTGDDVIIAGVGDLLENRFRLIRIGNDSVEVEEVGGSGRRATVAMEEEVRTP